MRALVSGLLLLVAAMPAAAQRGQVSVRGVVSDSTTARPLGGVLVALTGGARATRTDVAGQYVIGVPRTGDVVLEVRRIGYAPRRIPIQVGEDAEKVALDIRLMRLATLDTVQVRASDRAVYGIVATARELRPLAGAEVQLLSAGGKTKSDSTGHFFIPFKTGQTFVVRARAPGYTPQTMSITVPPKEGLEIVLLLDSAENPYPRRLEMAWADFDQRSRYGTNRSAIVPRTELLKSLNSPLLDALRSSPSFVHRSLRFPTMVCLFVDGLPQPDRPMWSFDMSEIELVETYTGDSFAGKELAAKWPPREACESRTGVPLSGGGTKVGPTGDMIRYVVVWLKR